MKMKAKFLDPSHLRIRSSVLDSHDAISDWRDTRARPAIIRRGGGLSFDWVWGCDRPPRRGLALPLSQTRGESVSGEREGEAGAEMGDAIDDRVRGRNHEIRARRRVGPAGGGGGGDDEDEREETRRARGPGRSR